MTLPYRALMWSDNEGLDVDKLNAMTNNDQWLFENMPRAKYIDGAVNKDAGIKVLGVRGYVPPTSGNGYTTSVYFGNVFSAGCKPIVVATAVSTNWQRRYICAVNGLGSLVFPDHNGCRVGVSADELNPKVNKIAAAVYVNVIAVGW